MWFWVHFKRYFLWKPGGFQMTSMSHLDTICTLIDVSVAKGLMCIYSLFTIETFLDAFDFSLSEYLHIIPQLCLIKALLKNESYLCVCFPKMGSLMFPKYAPITIGNHWFCMGKSTLIMWPILGILGLVYLTHKGQRSMVKRFSLTLTAITSDM